jgi:hypothetical protein
VEKARDAGRAMPTLTVETMTRGGNDERGDVSSFGDNRNMMD